MYSTVTENHNVSNLKYVNQQRHLLAIPSKAATFIWTVFGPIYIFKYFNYIFVIYQFCNWCKNIHQKHHFVSLSTDDTWYTEYHHFILIFQGYPSWKSSARSLQWGFCFVHITKEMSFCLPQNSSHFQSLRCDF